MTSCGARGEVIAARLNQQTLDHADTEPMLALLAPESRQQLRGRDTDPWYLSTRITPGFRLLPVPPRVTGSMAAAVDERGRLTVRTNYLIAYPFNPDLITQVGEPLDAIVLGRARIEYTMIDDRRYTAAAQGMWLGRSDGYLYSVACDWSAKGYLAPAYANKNATKPGGPSRQEIFDPNAPLPEDATCL
ncbi:hypothetical protein AB0H76_29990 [Nocardia sp. NPDC050712]|uniref:hypothetical protein n=1 Tax=Nocardia sp. NPDC050712 TaxID=3155518 RepID=UPI0033E90011